MHIFSCRNNTCQKKNEIFVSFLGETIKEWIQLKFNIFYNGNENTINYFMNINNLINNFWCIYGIIDNYLSMQKTFKQLQQINFAVKYTAQFKLYVDYTKYNNIALMDQFYNKLKPNLWKKLVKMLNNIFSNDFSLLINLKWNVIEVNQHFWDLKTNFQGRHAILTHKYYMHIKSCNPVNNNKLMENVWYNNIPKKNHAMTILKNQLFVTNVVN